MALVTRTTRPQAGSEPLFELDQVTPISRHGQIAKFSTTITIGLVGELFENERIWVDYDYQRGVKVTHRQDGTEQRTPMVDQKRVTDMANKILHNQLYGGALCWNLRDNEVEYSYDEGRRCLSIWSGKLTIPDSNHRHQAILKVYQLAKDRGDTFFDVNGYEFPLLIELLDLEGESSLFYEYNQLGKPANPTRSKLLNQANIHNVVTSWIIDHSKLKGNIELVTNNISNNSTKVATFNTLATAIEKAFPHLDEENWQEIGEYLAEFLDYLISVRSEVGYLPLAQRQKARKEGIGDSGLAFLGYVLLGSDLKNYKNWQSYVDRLGQPYRHQGTTKDSDWEGDLMSRENPLWQGQVLTMGRSGNLTVINRKDSRVFVHEALQQVVGLA